MLVYVKLLCDEAVKPTREGGKCDEVRGCQARESELGRVSCAEKIGKDAPIARKRMSHPSRTQDALADDAGVGAAIAAGECGNDCARYG